MSTSPLQRIAITGSSGLCGRALVRAIRARWPDVTTLGIDRAPPKSDPPDEFLAADILDPKLDSILRQFSPDTILHLAYIVEPSRDRRLMREVNVTGTTRILTAAKAVGVKRVLVSSSATIYGPWPEHAVPCREDARLRPLPAFAYAVDKLEVEATLAAFSEANPEITVAWTRPAIVCGKGEKNFLSDIFLTVPFMVLPGGRDTPLQFVHTDDLAAATLAILEAGRPGPFNIAPPDTLTQRDLAALMNIRAISLPAWLVTTAARIWWTLRLPWVRTPPGLAGYLAHPWLVDSSRLTGECGFSFTHSSREAFATLLPVSIADASRPA